MHRLGALAATLVLVAACAGSPAPTAEPRASTTDPSPPPVSAPPADTTAPASAPPSVAAPVLAGRPMERCTIHSDVPVTAEFEGFCGTLSVPEDRSNPAGRSVDLRVVVVPAAGSAAQPDPLFALAGGPGDASTTFFAWLPAHYADVHEARDIVLVDQRGTGESQPLTLPAMPDVAGMSPSEADDALTAWADESLSSLDVDPRFYTTTAAADDLDDVRAALGYEQINLYGTSYGATLAQYYMRQHGQRVRRAILDGATPLDVPVFELIARNSGAAMDLLLRRCEQDRACNAAFPAIVDEWATLRASLERGITIADPETGDGMVVNLATGAPSIHASLLTEATAGLLPLAIHLAVGEQWAQVDGLLPPGADWTGPALLMADEILCREAWARYDPATVASLGGDSYATRMEMANATTRGVRCRYLFAGQVQPDDAEPLSTDVPILWLTGDGDPQDPPANLATVMEHAPNSRIAVVPANEHVVGHLGCGPRVIAAFLDAPDAARVDMSCLAEGATPGLTFQLP